MAIEEIKSGDKARSSVLNDNFRYLSELVSELSHKIDGNEATIDSKLASVKNKLELDIQELETELNTTETELTSKVDSVTSNANSKLSATVKKSSNGYCKLSNGIIVQWGQMSHANNGSEQSTTVTFGTPFSSASSYQVVGSWSMMPKVGDKSFIWAITSKSSSSFVMKHLTSQSQAQSGYVYWIAVGY